MNGRTELILNRGVTPEWIRVPDAMRIFGVGRSWLYEAIADGDVKSSCIRKRNQVKGIRLISYDSMKAFVEQHVTTAI